MKKSVVICIAIIFLASIVAINFFGMKTSVYNLVVPVESVECINITDRDRGITVTNKGDNGDKYIRLKFEQACVKDENNNITTYGTMLTLIHKVYPENASEQKVKYIYSKRNSFEFMQDGNGIENGMILFYSKASFDVQIMSIDGRQAYTTVSILVY